MDIKAKIQELVDKIKNDKDLQDKFQKDPKGTVESLTGIDLPDEQIDQVIEGIKAKIGVSKIGDALGGLFGKK